MDPYSNKPDPRLEVSICEEDGFYDLRVGKDGFEHPGLVLIFNQTKFEPNEGQSMLTKERLVEPGKTLERTMKDCGFKVEYFENYTHQQIMNTIGKYATLKRRDKQEYASFLLFFLSHGHIKEYENIENYFQEIVKTADHDMLISDIWEKFENTDTWNNKPKCFFFQACRGKDLIEGAAVENSMREQNKLKLSFDDQQSSSYSGQRGPRSCSSSKPIFDVLADRPPYLQNNVSRQVFSNVKAQPLVFRDTLPRDMNYVTLMTPRKNPPKVFTEPKFSDLLIFHSTYQGALSFQETNYSPFVKVVDKHFREDIFLKDFLSIVQNIQKEIAYTVRASNAATPDAQVYAAVSDVATNTSVEKVSDIEGSRLMPMIQSTLTGKIQFHKLSKEEVSSSGFLALLPEHYNMQNGKGRAVVFAYTYEQMACFAPKPCVKQEVEELEKSFKKLKCHTTIHWDLTKQEFISALNELGTEDFSQYDFFCIVFNGYGFHDQLIVKNQRDSFEEEYVEVAELWQPFLGSRCPSLVDKPKIFIISAVGNTERPGVSGKFKRFVKKEANIELTREINKAAKCAPNEQPYMFVIPDASDILLVFHSTSGTANYMDFMHNDDDINCQKYNLLKVKDDDENEYNSDVDEYSSFFKILNEQLQNERNFFGDRHILDIIEKVQYKITFLIKKRIQKTKDGRNKREVPLVMSTLTKNFLLYVNNEN